MASKIDKVLSLFRPRNAGSLSSSLDDATRQSMYSQLQQGYRSYYEMQGMAQHEASKLAANKSNAFLNRQFASGASRDDLMNAMNMRLNRLGGATEGHLKQRHFTGGYDDYLADWQRQNVKPVGNGRTFNRSVPQLSYEGWRGEQRTQRIAANGARRDRRNAAQQRLETQRSNSAANQGFKRLGRNINSNQAVNPTTPMNQAANSTALVPVHGPRLHGAATPLQTSSAIPATAAEHPYRSYRWGVSQAWNQARNIANNKNLGFWNQVGAQAKNAGKFLWGNEGEGYRRFVKRGAVGAAGYGAYTVGDSMIYNPQDPDSPFVPIL